jgi:preprotein translocase subunit SecE
MAKSVDEKTVSGKAPATTGKAPAKQSSGGIKNPFSRSSSANSKQTTGPRGTVTTKPHGRLRTFLREVRVEMSKVTWPPRKELITSTGVVLVAVIIAGVYIGVWDFVWNLIVRAVGLG